MIIDEMERGNVLKEIINSVIINGIEVDITRS